LSDDVGMKPSDSIERLYRELRERH
jgi:hypothetical protein